MVRRRYAPGHNPPVTGEQHPAYRTDRFRWEHRGFEINGKPSPCRVWNLGLQSTGYAQQSDGKLVHRVAYEEHFGSIPDGWHVHHRCHQRDCSNYLHLRAMSPEEHARRHRRSDLTEEDVETIIRATHLSKVEVAALFGISAKTVEGIRIGYRWKDVVHRVWDELGGRPKYPTSKGRTPTPQPSS